MPYQSVRAYPEQAGDASVIPRGQAEELTGHAPGVACPFAVKEGAEACLDVSLRRFSVIHTAAGTDLAAIRLAMAELAEHAHPRGWADVCKGWLVNGEAPA